MTSPYRPLVRSAALVVVLVALGACGEGGTTTVTVTGEPSSQTPAQDDAAAPPLPVADLDEINRRDDVVQSSVTGFQSALSKCAVLAQNNELDATARCFAEKYEPYQEALIRMGGQLTTATPKASGDCASKLSSVRTSLGNLTKVSDELNTSFAELDFAATPVDRFAAAFRRYRARMDAALVDCRA
ncbi:MAG: hypothetical protein WKF96_15300 [Solirubrobacteraceae bacterium]